MKLNSKKTIGLILMFLLLGVAVLLLSGVLPLTSKNTHPPCEKLPSVEEAIQALENNKDFTREIESLGSSILVEVEQPCTDDQKRALIQVTYQSKSEEKAIRHLITKSEGFGVPIHLVKR